MPLEEHAKPTGQSVSRVAKQPVRQQQSQEAVNKSPLEFQLTSQLFLLLRFALGLPFQMNVRADGVLCECFERDTSKHDYVVFIDSQEMDIKTQLWQDIKKTNIKVREIFEERRNKKKSQY